MDDKYVLNGKNAVPESDLLAWAGWYQTSDRRVAKTQIDGSVSVSTVFLGLDHNFGHGEPELFETMIFGGERDQEQQRYGTWDEAEAGHAKIVEELSA